MKIHLLTGTLLIMAIACSGQSDQAKEQTPEAEPAAMAAQDSAAVPAASQVQDDRDWIAAAKASAQEQGIPSAHLVVLSEQRARHPEHVHGIDISHHQETIDWNRVSAAGVGFVYCKATEGIDLQDPLFIANWQALTQRKIPRGAYHMFRPEDEVKPQVDLFLATLRAGGMGGPMLPPVLDIERNSGVKKVSREVLHARAVEWVRLVEKELRLKPLIYTNPTFWKDYLGSDHELIQYPLWVSEYEIGASAPAHTAAWRDWALWQFSQYGIVDGIGKPVDLNRLSGTLESLYAGAGN
jgi:lysozyme